MGITKMKKSRHTPWPDPGNNFASTSKIETQGKTRGKKRKGTETRKGGNCVVTCSWSRHQLKGEVRPSKKKNEARDHHHGLFSIRRAFWWPNSWLGATEKKGRYGNSSLGQSQGELHGTKG